MKIVNILKRKVGERKKYNFNYEVKWINKNSNYSALHIPRNASEKLWWTFQSADDVHTFPEMFYVWHQLIYIHIPAQQFTHISNHVCDLHERLHSGQLPDDISLFLFIVSVLMSTGYGGLDSWHTEAVMWYKVGITKARYKKDKVYLAFLFCETQ